MHIEKNIILKRYDQKPIVIDKFYNTGYNNQPIVVFCHGYKGFKDWGVWDIMAKQIAKAGFCFVKFNFSHNGGTVKSPIDFPDLEAFGNNNYTRELDDLGDIIDWIVKKFKGNTAVDISKINLIGHSRGGGIAILKTSEDSRIKKLITLASVCDFEKRTVTTGDLKQWKKNGVKYVINGRTKQKMPHFYQFYEDFIRNRERLNIKFAVKKINIPHLVIHGDTDTSVSISEAKQICKWNPKSQLQIIENADHVFNVKHPWKSQSLPKEFEKLISSTIQFLK